MSDGNIEELFNAKDRILMVAWSLPNEGPLRPSQRDQAMKNFTRYIRQHGLTPADVGRKLGSPRATTISDLIRGTYRANADDNIRKLNMWIEQNCRQNAAKLSDAFVTTKVAKAMEACARLCRENGTMAMAVGPTGIGKSRCAQAIHETCVGSIYLRVITGYHTPRGLTTAIAECLGVRDLPARRAENCRRIPVERIMDALQDSNRLLLIDEAQQLTDASLTLLRDIHDTTGVPIMLIATKDLLDRILRTAGPDTGQTFSRYEIIDHLSEGKDITSGGKPMFTVDEIKAIYQHAPIRLSTDATLYLQSVANDLGFGSLRRCKILLRNAVRRARKRQDVGESEKVTVYADDLAWVASILHRYSGERETTRKHTKRAEGASTA